MSFSVGEDSESCAVCMERPCTMRYRPCGHAICCELCTIKACEPSQRRLRCPTCREEVAQLELMEGYEAAALTGALSYESVPVFLHAMFNSAAQEVVVAAQAVHGRWGNHDEGEQEAELVLTILNAAVEGVEAGLLVAGLWHLALTGNAEAVTALLTAAPGLDVNAANANAGGSTAPMLAAMVGHTGTVKVLLAAPGINVNAANVNGATALFRATAEGHTKTVTELLAAPGIDANAANAEGITALIIAVARTVAGDHTETVTALLAAPGLDTNAADGLGTTALMLAAGGGRTETVTALLAATGLDANAADGNGNTALTLAAGRGRTETVTALLAAPGLDVNAVDGDGDTALMIAVAGGHTDMATALQLASL